MSDRDIHRGTGPMDRLTELCAEMTVPLDDPENSDVKAIVFLHDGDRGGIVLHGYEDEVEAMSELFAHMKAVFQAVGKDLDFVFVPDSPQGLGGLSE